MPTATAMLKAPFKSLPTDSIKNSFIDSIKTLLLALQKLMSRLLPAPVIHAYIKANITLHKVMMFAEHHPKFTGVVAGTSVILTAACLSSRLLGFGALGPVKGSYAAMWQTMYGASVPAGSLFSAMQRWGMR